MNRLTVLFAAFAVAIASTGCTIKTIDAPVTVTTKPLPELVRQDVVQAGREVRGRSCSRIVLTIIPVGIATIEDAVADALEQAPGTDTLLRYEERTDVVVVVPFYTQVCTEVHGYAVASKTLAAR
jgi:hypothetical protein